ncbi:hypothetical protein B0H17DRAFT_1225464 [Mycena rosella]|uniref:DUF7223 domain-containing protein n=1 Tax=Mycena rosella TaxID=1033263 RepID=A0AAD7D925_MYCRO|nr:hypothetical protein B0H17DRAFT_1225464 [Mycena rosella]
MLSSILVIVPFLAGIQAANDWKVPCTGGTCSYDLPAANGTAPAGTLKIWGSADAITDITTAAGWQIIGCDPTALQQDVRLVCMTDPDDPTSDCAHLYQNIGAVNKIVRLPENCGSSAFARVSKSWVPDDQSIPGSVQRRIVRRDGTAPVVQALSLDTNFEAVDYSKTGMVNIAITAANIPGSSKDIKVPGSRRATSRRESAAKNEATKAASAVKDTATKAESAVKNEATKAASKVAGAAKTAASAIGNKTVDVNKEFDLKPFSFDKSVNLINQSLNCGANSATLNVDMDANANAQASITVAAQGTIVPPKFTEFGIIAGLTADVTGTLTMSADLSGHLDSGKINLVTLGIPGFSFPGIFTVGPSFQVDAQMVGDVDVAMDMTVGLNFNVNNAQLEFPPNANNKPDQSAFTIGDTPLTLNAAPNVQATGTITAHLIPSLNLGVSALGGKGKATIFLALDTNAALTMNLDGSGDLTKVKNVPIDNSAAGTGTTDDSTDDTTADDGTDDTTTADDGTTDDSTDDTTADDGTDDTTDATADDGTDDTTTDDGTDDTTADDGTDDSTTDDSTDDTTADDGTTDDSTVDPATVDNAAASDSAAAGTEITVRPLPLPPSRALTECDLDRGRAVPRRRRERRADCGAVRWEHGADVWRWGPRCRGRCHCCGRLCRDG